MDSRQGLPGQELWRPAASPRDSAVYRRSAVGSSDPGNLKELSKVEVYMDGGQLWYRPMDRDREEVGVPLSM